MDNSEQITCPLCEGDKKEKIKVFEDQHDYHLEDTGKECPRCKGTGKVTILSKCKRCEKCKTPTMFLVHVTMWTEEDLTQFDSWSCQSDVMLCIACFENERKRAMEEERP